MKKFILPVFVVFMLMSSYANASEDEPNWKEEFSFAAKRIVTVPKGYDDYDHRIYSFTDGDGRSSLLFVCHGGVNAQGQYFAYMGDKWHSDYASAIDNEIRYHINRGEIRANSFDKVYFLTCYSGYAPQRRVTLPVLRKNLQMVLYTRSVEGLLEYFDNRWQVYYVGLYKDDPGGPSDINAGVAKRIIRAGAE